MRGWSYFGRLCLWYIGAMIPKALWLIPLLLAFAAPCGTSQTAGDAAEPPSPAAAVPGKALPGAPAPVEDQQPRVIVTVPPPQPAPWQWHDRVAWAALVALPILLYAGIMLTLSTLKKIERQTSALEAATRAVADHAQAALLNAQAIVDAQRPWLLVAVEPSSSAKDAFHVTVSNRGQMPAQIVAALSQTAIAIDEALLPKSPEYGVGKPSAQLYPVILVPGESTTVKVFSRDDVPAVCASEDRLKRVENWEEKIYLYGKVIYRDLIARPGQQNHETAWCCWYIHGRQKSGMIVAGPPEYNLHT